MHTSKKEGRKIKRWKGKRAYIRLRKFGDNRRLHSSLATTDTSQADWKTCFTRWFTRFESFEIKVEDRVYAKTNLLKFTAIENEP